MFGAVAAVDASMRSDGRCDNRFAVLGGYINYVCTSSCEAVPVGGDEHWAHPLLMHDPRYCFACMIVQHAVDGCICIIVAGEYVPSTQVGPGRRRGVQSVAAASV